MAAGERRRRGWWARLVDRWRRPRRRTADEAAPRSIAGGPAFEVDRLIDALSHPHVDVRVGAAHELGAAASRGTEGAPVVAALTGALDDPDPSVRSSAALSLGEWGPAAASAVDRLVAALAEEDDDVRSSAGLALQDVGKAAVGPLTAALADEHPRVRAEARAVLALMSGPEADLHEGPDAGPECRFGSGLGSGSSPGSS